MATALEEKAVAKVSLGPSSSTQPGASTARKLIVDVCCGANVSAISHINRFSSSSVSAAAPSVSCT